MLNCGIRGDWRWFLSCFAAIGDELRHLGNDWDEFEGGLGTKSDSYYELGTFCGW